MDEFLKYADTAERMLFRRASAGRIPVNGSIEVSPLCNMDCDMCFVRLSPSEMQSKGHLRTAKEWLSIARQMKDAGVLFLLLTGGEPLLYPDLKELYLGLKKLGMIITINTNATLLDEEWAQFFAKNKPRRINVTLYGADDTAYSRLCHHPGGYEKTIQAIDLLKQYDIPFRLSYSLTRANAEDLIPFMDYAEQMELYYEIDPYMIPATRERNRTYQFDSRLEPEEAARYAHEIHRRKCAEHGTFTAYCQNAIDNIDKAQQYAAEHPEMKKPQRSGCLAGLCSFSVNWQGELRPCVILTKPGVNLFENTSFTEAWQTIMDGMDTLLMNEDCTVCPRRSICDNCPASALYETGEYSGKPDYLCRYTAELERLMRLEIQQSENDSLKQSSQ